MRREDNLRVSPSRKENRTCLVKKEDMFFQM